VTTGFATGLDTVELQRFERLLARTPEFAERYFTQAERERCRGARDFATTFAVKEALLKALGVGVLDVIALEQIEVECARGSATVKLSGAAANAVGSRRTWVSTACDGKQAWALVVLS
jgi:holo-[acyl-carrier protein] synthase